MSISTIQSAIHRLRKEINDLSNKIAEKRKKSANANAKANKAYGDAHKSKSQSTIKSKLSEYDKYSKEANKYGSEIADLEKKKVQKEKALFTEEKKLVKAQTDEAKKISKAQQRAFSENDKKIEYLTQKVHSVQLEQSKLKEIYPLLNVSSDEAYDVFISHASEDKVSFVDELVNELIGRDVKVWYDRIQLTWGKSIRYNIDEGLRKSKFAIIVLSEYYIQKYWTQKEFNALFARGSKIGDFLLPIWHNISPEKASEFSPMLSDSIAIKSSEWTIPQIADEFVKILNHENNG